MSLRVENLGFFYGTRRALETINFQVAPGETVGIVGPNGAGKSTLLKCLNRLLEPSLGQVMLNDEDVSALTPRQRAQRMSYIPQNLIPSPGLSVYHAVLHGRFPFFRWQPRRQDHDRVRDTLDDLGLTSLSRRPLLSLSGGERQRVLIARALCQEAQVVLFDEMTNNLDVRHQVESLSILQARVQERQLIALLVLHDLNLASLYCDRVLLLANGLATAVGTPQEVFPSAQLELAYQLKPLTYRHEETMYVLPRKQDGIRAKMPTRGS